MMHFPDHSDFGLVYGTYLSRRFPRVCGPMGPVPNVEYTPGFGTSFPFSGRYISEHAKNARYVFDPKFPKSKIYVNSDFWIISNKLKNILESNTPSSWEFSLANTIDENGSATEDTYWIAKVINFLDCVNEKLSEIDHYLEVELSEDLRPRFCNLEPDHFRTYSSVNSLQFYSASIPHDTQVFVPQYWPGNVIMSRELFTKVHSAVDGEIRGLCLLRPLVELHKLLRLYM